MRRHKGCAVCPFQLFPPQSSSPKPPSPQVRRHQNWGGTGGQLEPTKAPVQAPNPLYRSYPIGHPQCFISCTSKSNQPLFFFFTPTSKTFRLENHLQRLELYSKIHHGAYALPLFSRTKTSFHFLSRAVFRFVQQDLNPSFNYYQPTRRRPLFLRLNCEAAEE